MNASLEQNVEIFSNHYVQRFKFLLEGEMLNLQFKIQANYSRRQRNEF